MIDEKILTDEEAKFCLLYINGTYNGNAKRCYQEVFNELDETTAKANARMLLAKDVVKERIKKLRSVELYSAESLRPHITETLVKIMDECASSEYTDKDGNPIQPAAMRAVSVHSAKVLNDMYGIKEDIAHNINLNSENGVAGNVIFNVIAPEKRDKSKEEEALNEG